MRRALGARVRIVRDARVQERARRTERGRVIGRRSELAEATPRFAGRPCPRLIADVQRVLAQLDEKERRDVRVVLVSLDPARDTPAVLASVIEQRGLDPERTTLLVGSDADTRRLAALLGVKYREDGKGAIDHSSRIAVLDRAGRLVAKRDGLGGDVEATVVSLRAVLARR